MRLTRDLLICLLLAALTIGIACVTLEAAHALHALAEAPKLLAERISALQRSVEAIPPTVLTPVLAEVDHQANLTRDGLFKLTGTELEHGLARIDTFTAGLNIRVDQAVDKADSQLTGLRGELTPVLRQSAALVKDAQDTLDDAYPDVRGLLESSTVAATQAAQTAQTIRAAAPELVQSAQETSKQVAGITADVHKFTTKFTGPSSWKSKLWEGIKTGAYVGARVIP